MTTPRRPLPPALQTGLAGLAAFVVLAGLGGFVARVSGAPEYVASWFDGALFAFFTTVVVVLVSFSGGVALGATAALGPPWVAAITSRALEVVGALPTVIVAVVVRGLGTPSDFVVFVLVLGALRSLETAKVVRAYVLALDSEEFVVAARALGTGRFRLFRRHLFPHVLGPALASAVVAAAAVVGLDAALAFLGLGSGSPTWGTQIAAAAERHSLGLTFLPFAGLAALVVCLHVAADALERAAGTGRRFV